MKNLPDQTDRYVRQEQFAPLGVEGQQRLGGGCALIVGVGGLGSWVASLLARAGVGRLRLVDDDRVDWTNLARQCMYTQADAEGQRLKAEAAAEVLAAINTDVEIEARPVRATAETLGELADGVDVIIDGSDDWRTRFLLNDFAVRQGVPWVWGGVVECVGQAMTILPGETACLQCLYEAPPPTEKELAMKASSLGVLGPAVSMIASIQAAEALKILSDSRADVRRGLWQIDLWAGRLQTLEARRDSECPCCGKQRFRYLDA